MKSGILAAAMLFALPGFAAEKNPLIGVRSIWIEAPLATRLEMQKAIAKELPQLKFVAHDSADVILKLQSQGDRPVESVVRTTRSPRAAANGSIEGPSIIAFSRQIGGVIGVITPRLNPDAQTVLYNALPSPFNTTQFAHEFIKAYRDANR